MWQMGDSLLAQFVGVPRLLLGDTQCQFARRGLCIPRLTALFRAGHCFARVVRQVVSSAIYLE